MTDPIADMLNRIRNAQAVLHPSVDVPYSNFKYSLAEIFLKQGVIKKIEKKHNKTRKIIRITLKYKDNQPIISHLERISKPGRRVYASSKRIRLSRGGGGFIIVSTPKGLMIGWEARKQNLGGEIIAEIWQ
ncbi:30S ribosomal protein S8 [Patescibacteria group bacterium]|nr:30S ribosomal protein S8 [Patescibacteria group bacterium]MBU4162453.1 30S ribosomal protein S8 [Patescibacteria group bacterium]